jgi:RNase P/RNase MRP subunit p29
MLYGELLIQLYETTVKLIGLKGKIMKDTEEMVGKSNSKLENKILELDVDKLLELKHIGQDDMVVPVSIAAELKGVSPQAIYYAILRGKIVKVEGVLLSSLKDYEVDKGNQINGLIKAKGVLGGHKYVCIYCNKEKKCNIQGCTGDCSKICLKCYKEGKWKEK